MNLAASLACVPLVVVENRAVLDAVVNEAVGAGWTLHRSADSISPGTLLVMDVAVPDAAQEAVLLAVQGYGLVIHAAVERSVVDDLVEDLTRLGTVLLVDAKTVIRLEPDAWRLLHALAAGATVSVAARELHMSIRTANRRITDAKIAMGAHTRAQLMRSLTGSDRIPAARLNR